MAKKNRAHSFSFFDSHHGIERQTLYICGALTLLTSSFVVSQLHYNHVRYVMLEKVDQAGATSSFSKTNNVVLTLGKTRLSLDRHTAFIPITFSSTDNVGIKAKNYKFYIAASDGKPMDYRVTGHFIMYGSVGRSILVLHSPTTIKNQPLVLFIVNQKKVPTVNSDEEDQEMEQQDANATDFGKFDVAPFKINPGATDVKKHKRIQSSYTQVEDLYEQIFGSKDVHQIRKGIDADNRQIKHNKQAAAALVERLKSEGYEVPKTPDWVHDNWRPHDAINLETGKTRNGHNALTYQPQSDENSTDQFPTSLKNKDGSTTDDYDNQQNNADADSSTSSNSSSSDNQTSNGSSTGANTVGGTQTDPAKQWSDLQTAWANIKQLKQDIYVTKYQSLYRIRRQEQSILDQSSIGPGKLVVQKGQVKENK